MSLHAGLDRGLVTSPPAEADTASRLLATAPAWMAAIGVMRLADQTGLDTLGIPVVAAIRPNSRSVAVHQGKGVSRVAARVSALMEAAECFHAERSALPLRLATFSELDGAVDPVALPWIGAADPHHARLLWTEGQDFLAGRVAWVPFELVHADYTAPAPAEGYHFEATTNGLGAGAFAAQAQLHALCEVIERDAVTLWRAAGGPRGAQARVIDPSSVPGPDCLCLVERARAARVGVALWEVTSRTGLPVFVALLMPGAAGAPGIEPEIGAGCHPDPAVALRRALLEAAQARVTRIAGARDDFPPKSYDAAARAERLEQARGWFAAAKSGVAYLGKPAPPDIVAARDQVLEALACSGCDRAVWVDLSQATLPIAVGRMVVPGLAAPHAP